MIPGTLRRSEEFGISKDHVRIDKAAVRERKRTMVKGLIDVQLDNYKASGAELLMGSECFIAPRTLEVALPGGHRRGLDSGIASAARAGKAASAQGDDFDRADAAVDVDSDGFAIALKGEVDAPAAYA
jgi:hypothetical protein